MVGTRQQIGPHAVHVDHLDLDAMTGGQDATDLEGLIRLGTSICRGTRHDCHD